MKTATLPLPAALAGMLLFSGVSDVDLEQIYGRMHYKNFRKGDTILASDQKSKAVFWIHSGSVKICNSLPPTSSENVSDNRETVFNVAGPGALLGEINYLDGKGHSASVIALEKTTCFMLSDTDFRYFLSTSPQFHDNFFSHLATLIRHTTEKISSLTYQSLGGSIAEQILSLATNWGKVDDNGHIIINIPLTQNLLAQMTGHERSSVAHVLASFKKKNWIDINKNHYITVLDADALRLFSK